MASRGLGSLTLDLITKIGGFVGPLSQAERELDKRTRAMQKRAQGFASSIGKALGVGLGLSVSGVIAGTTAAIKSAVDRMDELRDSSIRLGIGVKVLSEYGYAAQQTGTDIDALGKGLKILAKNAADALNPKSGKSQIFEALGIQVTDATGKLKELDQLVPEIADKFKQLEDGTTKAALAQELFGKSGLDLIEFLNQGRDGLEEMAQKARDLGIVIDDETAAKADEFNDTLNDLKTAVTGLATQVSAELLPDLIELAQWARDFVKDGDGAKVIADQIRASFSDLAQIASDVSGVFKILGATFRGVASDLQALLLVGQAQRQAMFFDFDGAKESLKQARELRKQAAAESNAIADAFNGMDPANRRQGPLPTTGIEGMFQVPGLSPTQRFDATAPVFSAVGGNGIDRKALNDALGGNNPDKPKSGTKKTGKSDAEREAEQLKAAYDRMNESLSQQIALFGKDGEEAKVRYEIEHGELAKLSQAQKDALIVQAQKIDQMRDEAEVQKQLDDTNKRRQDAVKQVLDDIQTERDLLGQTAEYQDTYNKLKYAGVDANSAFGQSIIAANHELHEQAKATAQQVEAMDAARDSAKGFFEDLREGVGIWEALGNAADDFFAKIMSALEDQLIEQLFGQRGTTGANTTGGNWLSGFLGNLFGNKSSAPVSSTTSGSGWGGALAAVLGSGASSASTGSTNPWLNALAAIFGGGRAAGGPVQAGHLYEVNEKGVPETLTVGNRQFLMMGTQSGHVTPSGAGGGDTYAPSFTFLLPRRIDNRAQQQVAQAADRAGRDATRRNGGRR